MSKRLKRLANLNGLEEPLRKTKIVKGIRKKMSVNDELAILRKAVAYLFEIIAKLHDGELSNEEFKQYNEHVESIKALVKADIESEVGV